VKASLSSDIHSNISRLSLFFNHLNDAVRLIDCHGKLCYTNPSADRLLALTDNPSLRLNSTDWMPAFTVELWHQYWQQLHSAKPYTYVSNIKTKHGKVKALSVVASLLEYQGDEYSLEILSSSAKQVDIESKDLQLQREQYMRTLLDNFPFMVWLKDADSKLLAANTAYAKMAGVPSTKDLEGKTDFDFFPDDLAQQYVEGDREAMLSDQPIGNICAIQDAHGESFWIESYKSPLVIDNQVVGTVGYARDVTKTLQNEREYRSLIENSPSSIVRFNKDNKRIFLNAKKADFYQVSPEFLLGKSPTEFPGGDSALEYEALIQDVFLNGKNRSIDLHWQSGSHGHRVIRSLLAPEFDINGEIIAVIGMGLDVTESIEYEMRIHRLAYFDPLTNLPNRTLLTDRLSQAILKANRNNKPFALITLDLDKFKEINDALGHVVGDILLVECARKLEACLRRNDTVARLGGDEFAILLSEIKEPESVAVIVRKVMQAFSEPFLISGKELFVTWSIGVAIFPLDSDQVDELFKYADSALYYAKEQGRNNVQFYSKELTIRATERMSLEASLRKAISKDEFELYYQPQVNLVTQEIIGVEALLRWNRDHTTMVPPDKFIGIAEDSGLIIEIGEWVIYHACIAAVKWNAHRTVPFPVAINLSSRQFIRNDLIHSITHILKKTGCQPAWLKLEITESLLLENNREIKKTIHDLHRMGFAISIDDFGTGYSALGYLIHFPVSQIKIDRSFIQDITTNPDRGLLVKAIISMSDSLRINIIAEGVETLEQAEYLTSIGCLHAQGYLFGRPMPYKDLSYLEI
jgi:diguanylate cyclase (GGDEF)-like protein/PAS domain S-box-containing protein